MKVVLITGGAGTIGRAFIKRYYKDYIFHNISRSEGSQVDLKRTYPNITNHIGSIEDIEFLFRTFGFVRPDIVIHSAAMKHVDIIEVNPIQACKVNIVGSINVITASIKFSVPISLAISTDKACSSLSVYGDTKYLMERCFLEANSKKNKFAVCRFANVAHSNGSVLPFWLKLKKEGKPLKLTNPKMSRLMFSKEDAAELIYKSVNICEKEEGGFVCSIKMKKVAMIDLAKNISDEIQIVGERAGEKYIEDLISEKELPYTYVFDNYIIIKKEKNTESNTLKKPYNSSVAKKMSQNDIRTLIYG